MIRIISIVVLALCCVSCGGGSNSGGSASGSSIEGDRSQAGGATTTTDRTSQAFENPASNLNNEELNRHFDGDVDFGAAFVTAPAPVNPGLGPVFNNRSCENCHTKNGRGLTVLGTGGLGSQALVRVSLDSGVSQLPGAPGDVPGLGTQIQDHAIFGAAVEAAIELSWITADGEFADGESYQLREPALDIRLASGEQLDSSVRTSLRVPQPVFGLGLLEAIPEERILSLADPDDADGDGISGRPNMVFDVQKGDFSLGRFGRKANQPSLVQQTAAAYANDMGVGNPLFADSEGNIDISIETVESAEFYVQTLAVPRAINLDDPLVKEGESLFLGTGCAGCHVPSHVTGEHKILAVSNQTIYPFTDMLLHDMGPGLADGRPDYIADGNEWRTPPLWGIGATSASLGNQATFLHDGRARSLTEAILWHGGEAEGAKNAFKNLSKSQREALITFLNSL